jgi:hypothetical protein
MFIYEAVYWDKPVSDFILYVLKTFFFTGWRHLWYLLAIIYTIVILIVASAVSKKSSFIIYCLSFPLLLIGITVSNYGKVFLEIPLFGILSNNNQSMIWGWMFIVLPFFMLGYYLSRKTPDLYVGNQLLFALLSLLGLFLEILLTTLLDLHNNVVLCLFTYPTVLYLFKWALKNPNHQLSVAADYSAGIASVIYFTHIAIANELMLIHCTGTLSFLICVLVPAVVGFILVGLGNAMIRRII